MPTQPHQYSLALITHTVQNSVVEQRAEDGYINATAMCKAAGKLFGHYRENGTTKEFLQELETDIGIPISGLVQTIKGGNAPQGTWVHPQVAINLAQWLSPKFAVQVSKWVHEWMSGKGKSAQPASLPWHLQRHMMNLPRVPATHFSILQEMAAFLVGPMEAHGHRLSEKMMPDISQAKMLCAYLRKELGIDTKSLPKYLHDFPDGRRVEANLYPVEHLPLFRRLMAEKWLPHHAYEYFKSRDPAALPALDKILMLIGPTAATGKIAANKPKLSK